jgi:hypothetical protein
MDTLRLDFQKILFVTPTRLEANAVRRGFRRSSHKAQIEVCGMGIRRAAAFCGKLDPNSLSALVLLGWAGGLSEDLGAGDVIIASHALMEGGITRFCHFLPIPNAVTAPMLTSPGVLKSIEEKQAARFTGAHAVEMEAYPMADWAHQHRITFIHARVILDTMNEPLPHFRSGKSEEIRGRASLKNPQAAASSKLPGGLFGWIRRFKLANAQLSVLAERVLLELDQNTYLEDTKAPIP